MSINLRSRRLHHCVPQVSYHRRSHQEDRESKQINLICRNKQEESHKMRRQIKNLQSKRKEESPERVLNEIKASKLSDTEFKIMVIRMVKDLSENYKELQGRY